VCGRYKKSSKKVFFELFYLIKFSFLQKNSRFYEIGVNWWQIGVKLVVKIIFYQ
jgi:hypothetical protein